MLCFLFLSLFFTNLLFFFAVYVTKKKLKNTMIHYQFQHS